MPITTALPSSYTSPLLPTSTTNTTTDYSMFLVSLFFAISRLTMFTIVVTISVAIAVPVFFLMIGSLIIITVVIMYLIQSELNNNCQQQNINYRTYFLGFRLRRFYLNYNCQF